MVVVPQQLIERLQEVKNSSDSSQRIGGGDSLDMQMHRILNVKHLDDSEKWKQYQQVLQRFLHIAEQKRQPINVPVMDRDSVKMDNELVEEIAETFTRHYRSDARKLLKMIAAHSDVIRWDKDRHVYVHNQKLPGANIVDIMHSIVRLRRHADPPPGWIEVMEVLKDLNIPITYINNPDALSYLGQDPYRQPSMLASSEPSSVFRSTITASSPYTPPLTRARSQIPKRQTRPTVFDTPSPSILPSRPSRLSSRGEDFRPLSPPPTSVLRRWESFKP